MHLNSFLYISLTYMFTGRSLWWQWRKLCTWHFKWKPWFRQR